MMEAGLFPDRGEQDIEAEICSRLQYEKIAQSDQTAGKTGTIPDYPAVFSDAVRGSWQGSFVFHRMP